MHGRVQLCMRDLLDQRVFDVDATDGLEPSLQLEPSPGDVCRLDVGDRHTRVIDSRFNGLLEHGRDVGSVELRSRQAS